MAALSFRITRDEISSALSRLAAAAKRPKPHPPSLQSECFGGSFQLTAFAVLHTLPSDTKWN